MIRVCRTISTLLHLSSQMHYRDSPDNKKITIELTDNMRDSCLNDLSYSFTI